jgi:hypothetical protein
MNIKISFISAMVFVLMLVTVCIFPPAVLAGPQAPKVNMITCLPAFVGAESIVLKPTFKITNPNGHMISVSLDYQLTAETQLLGKSQLPDAYIPAGGAIEISDVLVIPFMSWFASEVLSGKSKKATVMAITPLWKGLGGKRPAAIKEGIWKKIPAKKASLVAAGSVITLMGESKDIFHIESKYTD